MNRAKAQMHRGPWGPAAAWLSQLGFLAAWWNPPNLGQAGVKPKSQGLMESQGGPAVLGVCSPCLPQQLGIRPAHPPTPPCPVQTHTRTPLYNSHPNSQSPLSAPLTVLSGGPMCTLCTPRVPVLLYAHVPPCLAPDGHHCLSYPQGRPWASDTQSRCRTNASRATRVPSSSRGCPPGSPSASHAPSAPRTWRESSL
jgi:hypothetical protein